MVVLTPQLIKAKTKQDNIEDVRNLNLWGQEVSDLSVLEHMPNVEVLSLSVNKIASLRSFRHCTKLQELYLRKNEVRDIGELRYLKRLQQLKVLWLLDNPCAEQPDYRLHVARNLPSVSKLDNRAITDEERQACRGLAELPVFDDAQEAAAGASTASAPLQQGQQPQIRGVAHEVAAAAALVPAAQQQASRQSSKNILYAIMALINEVEAEDDLLLIKAAVEQQLAGMSRQ